jgi:outer membrane protein TolC
MATAGCPIRHAFRPHQPPRFGRAPLARASRWTCCWPPAAPAPEPAPGTPLPTSWKSAPPPGWISTADAPAAWQEGRWWALFADAPLDALMQRVEVGNQNLAQAMANVAQAQALLRQAEAQWAPRWARSWAPSAAAIRQAARRRWG